MKMKPTISVMITILFLMVSLESSSADIAPPLQPSGANPGLLEFEDTKVEMFYENVQILVQDESKLYYSDREHDAVNAHVSAFFIMANRGETTETLDTVFPLTNFNGSGDGWFGYPELRNFKVRVDDVEQKWTEVTTPNPSFPDEEPVKWAQFSVNYPPGENVFIDVEYDVQSTGYLPEAKFSYILSTGSGWYGPINEAHIYLILPYAASRENVLHGDYYGSQDENFPEFEGKFEGNKVHWEYYDIEPDIYENWSARILSPVLWQEVLNLRQRIDDGDALVYAEITAIYDRIIMEKPIRPGTENFIPLNIETYKKAAQIEPKNDELLARYAEFLLMLNWIKYTPPEGEITLEEIYLPAARALEINPENKTAQHVIFELENLLDFKYEEPTPETEEAIQSPDTETSAEMLVEETSDSEAREMNRNLFYLIGAGIGGILLGVLIMMVARKRV